MFVFIIRLLLFLLRVTHTHTPTQTTFQTYTHTRTHNTYTEGICFRINQDKFNCYKIDYHVYIYRYHNSQYRINNTATHTHTHTLRPPHIHTMHLIHLRLFEITTNFILLPITQLISRQTKKRSYFTLFDQRQEEINLLFDNLKTSNKNYNYLYFC